MKEPRVRPGLVRRALGTAPRTAVVAVGLLVGGVLLAGCAADGGDGEARDAATAPTGPSTSSPSPGTTTDTGPVPPQQTQDPDMTQPPDETTQPDATEPPDATQAPTGTAGVLTEQDSGAQVTLVVGEERPLQLGSAWSWSEPVVDGAAVTLTPVDYLVDPGYVEWLVTGAAAGSATLEVVGEPACGDTTVCPPTTVTLDVEVTG